MQIAETDSGAFYVDPLARLETDLQYADKSVPKLRHAFRSTARPVGEWNKLKITSNGEEITVKLNGELMNSGKKASPQKGRIGILSQEAEVEFRNIRILVD